VREAAVFAIAQSGVRSDAARPGLLAVAQNAAESREIRDSALQALERFPLTREEYSSLDRLRTRSGG
jgi:hypothetical protein